MPTPIAALRKEFLLRFAELLTPLGFKRAGQDFRRKTPYGHDAIDVYFVAYPGKAFGVNLVIGVRHEEVERVANEFSPRLPAERRRWTTTVGNRLDNLHGQPLRWTWHISNEAELEEALSRIVRVVETVTLPYFKRFSTVEAALEVLSPDGTDARRHCLWEPTQAKKALAAAFVLGKQDAFEEIAARKLKLLEDMSEHNEFMASFVPEVKALLTELRKRWPKSNE